MFEKGLNNKGQEGLTLTTLLLIVLGIVVVVVIIIGATKGFGFIFGKVDSLPGQSLQTAIESCNIAGKNDLRADYCLDIKKIEMDGVEQYVTCGYLGDKALLDETISPVCGETVANFAAFCDNQKLKDSALVEGITCEAHKA
ncbi:hypothetical protein COU60_04640 [Candidatus Pacearchaeota archaeon CG10_big_fil_rev_8_21_14_0_10_34_76]|nr:MAG: hypothetical protein COU60_04640 [Candidatus Pacearchaeota archaeon CG10_big_fil_rev_8_21_14_0_10_34_76]